MAAERGLILVDTKYEFFEKDGYEENLAANLPQKQLSKEFVREWLIANEPFTYKFFRQLLLWKVGG
eukprot:gene44852-60760_t